MSLSTPLRPTVVDVDLDAIADNYRALRDRGGGAAVIAVVKDDAYGHGVEAVASTLVDSGAEMLAVFTVEEALVLRQSGIRAPVLVLSGAATREERIAAAASDVALVVWTVDDARSAGEAAAGRGKRAVVHFKVDTGLTRLGAPLDEAVERFKRIRADRHIQVEGVMTHFASADETDLATTREQLARLDAFLDAIGEPPRLVHASASAGIAALGRVDRLTAIRPGLSLYGLYTAPHLRDVLRLRPALEWRSQVRRVTEAKRGTGVSYGHEYRLERDGRIATVPVGYGDGVPRAFARNGRLLLRGRAVPVAGRVAMDLVMLDVTDMPEVREGDEVVVIGRQGAVTQTPDDVADALGTIGYEVVTGIRRRVPRRYTSGGRVVAVRTLAGGYARV